LVEIRCIHPKQTAQQTVPAQAIQKAIDSHRRDITQTAEAAEAYRDR